MKTTNSLHKQYTKFVYLLSRRVAGLVLASFMLQGCGGALSGPNASAPTGAAVELFTDAEPKEAAEAEAQAHSYNSEPAWRRRLVRVNFNNLKNLFGSIRPAMTFPIRLFDDKTVQVRVETVDRVSATNYIVVGRIKGDEDSAVTLVMNNDVLVANIKRGDSDESFEIRMASNGVHEIRIPDDSRSDEKECEPVAVSEKEREGDAPMIKGTQPDQASALADDGSGELVASPLALPTIDMLVAYTPKARAAQGGASAILALIQMGIADTNRAFADSGVNLQVRLVGTKETLQSESTNMGSDLSALRSKTDTRFNEVHAERTRLGADQVTLVGAYSGISTPAGIGYVNSSATSAFTVVKSAYFRQYTFSHELGHNIGLNHEDGYQSSAGRFRTIIAYGSYTRIRRFSNPNRTYNGYRTGDSYRNESRILNSRGSTTAGLLSARI